MALELPVPETASLRTPRNYQVLRDEHARATNALDQHVEQTEAPNKTGEAERQEPGHAAELSAEQQQEPTRPNQMRSASPGWTDRGDMASQQMSANQYNTWIYANLGNREAVQAENAPNVVEREAATAELDRHCDGQQRDGQQNGNAPDRAEALEALERNEASQERGDNQIESQSQQRDSAPQEVASWDAWEARVEANEAPQRGEGRETSNRDAALEAVDQHIESPEQQPEVQPQQPEIEQQI